MDGFSSAQHDLRSVQVPRSTSQQPTIPKVEDRWRWMGRVRCRAHDTAADIVYTSPSKRDPRVWNDIARLAPAELDIFDPRASLDPNATIPYDLRVVSLPGELLQVGDRRMARRKPNGRVGELQLIVALRREGEERSLELGASREACRFPISLPESRQLKARNADELQFIVVDMEEVDVGGRLAEGVAFETALDEMLGKLESPHHWFFEHLVADSAHNAVKRLEVFKRDEERLSSWLRMLDKDRS